MTKEAEMRKGRKLIASGKETSTSVNYKRVKRMPETLYTAYNIIAKGGKLNDIEVPALDLSAKKLVKGYTKLSQNGHIKNQEKFYEKFKNKVKSSVNKLTKAIKSR